MNELIKVMEIVMPIFVTIFFASIADSLFLSSSLNIDFIVTEKSFFLKYTAELGSIVSSIEFSNPLILTA